jgi:enoyl-CoA hydratase
MALRLFRGAPKLGSLRACLEVEAQRAVQFLDAPDFVEGVRAQVVDKDRNPKWQPPTLEQVTDTMLDHLFPPAPPPPLFEV